MIKILMPYGASRFGGLVVKASIGKQLMPYGSEDLARLVAKVGDNGKSLAPYGANSHVQLIAKAGGQGKRADVAIRSDRAASRLKVIRLNAQRD